MVPSVGPYIFSNHADKCKESYFFINPFGKASPARNIYLRLLTLSISSPSNLSTNTENREGTKFTCVTRPFSIAFVISLTSPSNPGASRVNDPPSRNQPKISATDTSKEKEVFIK